LIHEKAGKSLLALICLVMLQLPVQARAQDASLSAIKSAYTEDHLTVSFTVTDCFTDDLNRAIESGIDTTFTFLIRLYETRKFRRDKRIADRKIKHTIKYDHLKKIYEVKLSEQSNTIVTVTDYDVAQGLMSRVQDLEVCSLEQLTEGRNYKLQMMAELDKIRLPLYLHYVFFFLSLWDFKTAWYVIEFTH